MKTPSAVNVSNERAWERMARLGRVLVRQCDVPSRTDGGTRGTPFDESELQTLCAQLLTTYVATDQPALVNVLANGVEARWHLHGEPALRVWYAERLLEWFGDSAGGKPSAFDVVDALLQQSSEASTIHQSLLLSAANLLVQSFPGKRVHAHVPTPEVWPSEPPPGTPFPPSRTITGIEFSGTFSTHGRADWWFGSWGADDVMYTTYAGGMLDDSSGTPVSASLTATGRALIRGSDPLHIDMVPLRVVERSMGPYDARFPSANLMYHGVWYVGTYTISSVSGCYDFCAIGPMAGFDWSDDKGRTWHAPPPSVTPAQTVFGDTIHGPDQIAAGARVKLAAAHFVDFGKDMQYSPDGKAYLIGHGSTAPDSRDNWLSGDQIYLARVTPSPQTINDAKAWEFYTGRDSQGRPRWSHSFTDIQPLLEWKDHLGHVTVTYDAPLKKYLLFTVHQRLPTLRGPFDMMVMEADQLTGPWRLVSYMNKFGPQAYSVTVPSKFISADGCTMWLSYTANFSYGVDIDPEKEPAHPFGSGYWMTLHKIRLLGPSRCRRR